jgi:hypothetical protein
MFMDVVDDTVKYQKMRSKNSKMLQEVDLWGTQEWHFQMVQVSSFLHLINECCDLTEKTLVRFLLTLHAA